MGFLKEFKAFALKGNVMDMAVGVIIGGAFGKMPGAGRSRGTLSASEGVNLSPGQRRP